MKDELGDSARSRHIFECINEIERAVKGHTEGSFVADHVLRIAVVKWLEIIGEASRHISQEVQNKYDHIEWRSIIGLRNFVVHEYFGVNYNAIWQTATRLLPELKMKLTAIELN